MGAICANQGPIYLMQLARSDSLINVTRDLSSKRHAAELYIRSDGILNSLCPWNTNDKYYMEVEFIDLIRRASDCIFCAVKKRKPFIGTS